MYLLDHMLLSEEATIEDAMRAIDTGATRIALVANTQKKLLGCISDGDIRRALLQKKELSTPAKNIMNPAPITAMVQDTREIILRKALQHNVYQIPIIDSEGIIHGLDDVRHLLQPRSRPNTVVLMAGGLGTRLRPLTEKKPKPLLSVGGKPIMETILNQFTQYGFQNFIISVNYKADMIIQYFGDGSKYGVNIEYVKETKRMGTAGALSLMRHMIDGDFFVMNGDLLTKINLEHMLNFHTSNNSSATMAVRQYDIQVPYGVVETKNNKIYSIKEKPKHSFYVNAGIYILNKKILSEIPENVFFDMPTLFQKACEKGLETLSFPIHEYWLDIGKMADFERANHEFGTFFNA